MKTQINAENRTENNGRTRAFRGANGWYIATEDASGTHHQGYDRHSDAEAAWEDWDEREADAANYRATDPCC
jgi:hypothetical protein